MSLRRGLPETALSCSLSAALFAVLFTITGCASLRSPVIGVAYSDVHAGVSASSNTAGNRVGEACATSYLGLVATGDASIEAARRNGGVTLITSVDEAYQNYVFGAYQKYCTIVRGR